MKIKFTYNRPGGAPVDLIATTDSATTVGDLAEHVRRSDPQGTGQESAASSRIEEAAASSRITLTLLGEHNIPLDPDLLVADSALTSGSRVSLGVAGSTYAGAVGTAAAARIRILIGPDIGKEFGLAHGSAIIGRDPGCDIVLTDPLVSRRHARINVSDVVEVIDLGSANGVGIGTSTVPRATLRPSDVVSIGDTELAIRLVHASATGIAASNEFNRSPRVNPPYVGREHHAPEPPERTRPQRFPMVALLAPVLMGAVLYLVTKSATSLIFIALSPVMMVGNAIESRFSSKRDFKRAVEEFESDLEALRQDVETELVAEAEGRRSELPLAVANLAAVRSRTPLVWSRRPDIDGLSDVAFGLGSQPSRSSVEYPRSTRAPHALRKRALEVLGPLTEVHDVPVAARFVDGALGVAGPRSVRLGLARSLVVQIAALRSPSEVVLCGFFGAESAEHWDWVKWLPHTSSPHTPVAAHHVPATPTESLALLTELENLLAERTDGNRGPSLPLVVVLVESDGAESERARLVTLAEQGASVGIHVLWMAPETPLLPAACKTFAQVDTAGGPGSAGFVQAGTEVLPVTFDRVSAAEALEAALQLSPLVDSGAVVADESDLPRSVSQFSLLGADVTASASIIERWQQNHSILTGPYAPAEPVRRAGNLRALVGQSPVGPHVLDLRADGPHALVGGTTGSGKSELLQSWILSLAATHSPQRVTFLLVDYKGGAAFADCEKLPHSTGLVTDLSPHMVRRALTSLGAELRNREELLKKQDAKDLQALEARGFTEAPPSLVVVVDEFARLRDEVPEFFDGMIDIAQRGRSLGIHLILATQRPTGVITGNLRANTNLRLALRVADEADSTDIIGTAAAAAFDPDIPGRAVSKAGPGRLVPFQASYAGGWTTDERDTPEILVEELTLLAPAVWELPPGEPVVREKDSTDIKRLVRTIRKANTTADLPQPPRAWLPVLPDTLSLTRVLRESDGGQLAFSLADAPEQLEQPVAAFHPDQDGSMVVYGTGGAGKSTALRSIAIAAGLWLKDGPCQVYGLDFGSRGLEMLDKLPHVGSIIQGDDHERVVRLLDWLGTEIRNRAQRYSPYNVSSLPGYRRQAKAPAEPRILLLLDGLVAFRAAYDASDRIRWVDKLSTIASEGRQVGVHVVLASETRSGLTTSLASSVQRRLVLRMALDEDYSMLGVETDVLTQKSPPGRGLMAGLEVQVGVLGGSPDPVVQAAEVVSLAEAMCEAGTRAAPAIRSLATQIPFEMLAAFPGTVPIGVAADDLQVLAVEPRGAFLLGGAARSGRTTAVELLATSYARTHPGAELYYFGNRRSKLADLRLWTSTACGVEEIQRQAADLVARLTSSEESAPTAVFLESAGDQVAGPAEQALQQLVRTCTSEEHWFVAEGEMSSLSGSAGFLGLVKAARTGLVLQPDPDSGQTLYRTPFGVARFHRDEFPEGRGMYVSGGRFRVVQVAVPPATREVGQFYPST